MTSATTAKKGSVGKVKPPPIKTSLDNPYMIKWNPVVGDDMQFILQTLQKRFQQLGFQKVEPSNKPKKFSCKKRKGAKKGQSNVIEANLENMVATGDAGKNDACLEEAGAHKPGWTHVDLRKQLAIGINEVTRALEKNELYLVLVCKSAKPAMITIHLIELSASRAVPAGQVPRLSESLAPVLGLKSVLALGFRKHSSHFEDEVKAIKEKVPPLIVPWINPQAVENKIIFSSPAEEPSGKAMEESVNVSQANLKRKAEDNPVQKSDSRATSSITLQPLKIKKLVPNPNRTRKPPKMKKTIAKK
ncbi:ribonuclease P protein subunit p38 [Ambystoma mexicanum]|uniref:ribonuclease P protein subunit p38 n=1 Tax=Ambystoma mexicanum TaxID=8296 RepID=UPI0037E8C216